MSKRSVSILGCGWLGLPLAQHLIKSGFLVKGSTTSRKKIETLRQSGITPYLINVHPRLEGDEVASFFQSDILFLNIPFRRDLDDPSLYKDQIDSVIACVENSPIRFVIFASSTSVYPDHAGLAKEDAPLNAHNKRAGVLLNIEQSLKDNTSFRSTIIRFAGLYGGSRQIGRFLSGSKNLGRGDAPANLIHLDDCIAIVARIIEGDIQGETFNACSDGHPARKELYTHAAKHLGVSPPEFTEDTHNAGKGKIVINEKLKARLGYQFKHPDPLAFS